LSINEKRIKQNERQSQTGSVFFGFVKNLTIVLNNLLLSNIITNCNRDDIIYTLMQIT
jgi:hypothetical protein